MAIKSCDVWGNPSDMTCDVGVSVYVFLGEHNGMVDMMRNLQDRALLDTGEYIIIYVDPFTFDNVDALRYFRSKFNFFIRDNSLFMTGVIWENHQIKFTLLGFQYIMWPAHLTYVNKTLLKAMNRFVWTPPSNIGGPFK